ncbi:hypothetical protein ACIQPR_18910 [Streptomyces sp. NPDC091280]|uniref:hypothetical protein n=1 Tax=Streptomyces sp. NPDC091280 TaxID=3365984 RepID=UPI0038248C88
MIITARGMERNPDLKHGLVGVTKHDASVAFGLIDFSQQLGATLGIGVASTLAASQSRSLPGHGHATADTLSGGFHQALGVCGLVGLTAVPIALLLVRQSGITWRVSPRSVNRCSDHAQ